MFNDADESPTQGFALARWQSNPKISPSSWRVLLGCTVSKVAFDGRCGLQGLREAMAVGCNLVVVPVAGMDEAVAVIGEDRKQVVVVGVGAPQDYKDGADWWVWEVGSSTPDKEGLMVLERAVKAGMLGAYGVSGETDLDLKAWLDTATAGAEAVWGRKKRSGLRVVEVPLNGAEQGALRDGKGDSTGCVLDEAARLGMAVLVRRAAHWRGTWGEVEVGYEGSAAQPDALAALVAVGEAEKHVQGLSGGVLPALAVRASPWPTRQAWRVFEGTVWPELQKVLAARGETTYVEVWQRLLPYGEGLAAASEGRLAVMLAQQLADCLPETWRNAAVLAQAWGLASSVPGVGAVVADLTSPAARKAMVEAMEKPDVVNVKMALDGVIHRA